MAVVGALEGAIDIQMKFELRGIFLLAYPSQVCVQVFVDIRFIRRWRLDLVGDRGVESQCFVDHLNNLKNVRYINH